MLGFGNFVDVVSLTNLVYTPLIATPHYRPMYTNARKKEKTEGRSYRWSLKKSEFLLFVSFCWGLQQYIAIQPIHPQNCLSGSHTGACIAARIQGYYVAVVPLRALQHLTTVGQLELRCQASLSVHVIHKPTASKGPLSTAGPSASRLLLMPVSAAGIIEICQSLHHIMIHICFGILGCFIIHPRVRTATSSRFGLSLCLYATIDQGSRLEPKTCDC